ncbi:hypothetical protein IK146_01355 [Candidatus Saccharibacteria bacterium]|nr:hypothetical protein [Candidatus Saccharibacteria bacterium]
MPIPKAKKTVRYMDFISRKPSENSDPLASRPDARPAKQLHPVVRKARSVADQIPSKGSHEDKLHHMAIKKEPELTVKKEVKKPLISREPATSRDLYAESIDPDRPKSATQTKYPDDLAIKASAALSGNSKPAEKSPNGDSSTAKKSPFLSHYTVDKRPLSNSVPAKKGEQFEKLSYLGVGDQGSDSSLKKNIYAKPESSTEDSPEKTTSKDDTVKIIDDTAEKRGVPAWVIILITIILGAAVGAGAYFLIP